MAMVILLYIRSSSFGNDGGEKKKKKDLADLGITTEQNIAIMQLQCCQIHSQDVRAEIFPVERWTALVSYPRPLYSSGHLQDRCFLSAVGTDKFSQQQWESRAYFRRGNQSTWIIQLSDTGVMMTAMQMHLWAQHQERKQLFKLNDFLGISHMETDFGIRRQQIASSANRF